MEEQSKHSQVEIDKDIDSRTFKLINFIWLVFSPLTAWCCLYQLETGVFAFRTIQFERSESPFMFWLGILVFLFSSLYLLYMGLEPFIYRYKNRQS